MRVRHDYLLETLMLMSLMGLSVKLVSVKLVSLRFPPVVAELAEVFNFRICAGYKLNQYISTLSPGGLPFLTHLSTFSLDTVLSDLFLPRPFDIVPQTPQSPRSDRGLLCFR